MTIAKLVVRLDTEVVFENELLNQYNKIPRSRRQEFVRKLLQAGYEQLTGVGQSKDIAHDQTLQKMSSTTSSTQNLNVDLGNDVGSSQKSGKTALGGLFGSGQK